MADLVHRGSQITSCARIDNLDLHRSPQVVPQRRKLPRPHSKLLPQLVTNLSTSLKQQLKQLKLDKVDVVRLESVVVVVVVVVLVLSLVLVLELDRLLATWISSGTTLNFNSFGSSFINNHRCSNQYFSNWVLVILNSLR
jgi:hypothetical protein